MDNYISERELIVLILQIVALYNAINQGWMVKIIGPKKYELTRPYVKEKYDTINIENFLQKLVAFNY